MKAVEFYELSKWYGDVLGLNEITLFFEPGIIGLLGPNGAGKSTMMKIMCGLLKPSRGNCLVLGKEPFNEKEIFRKIGYCPEITPVYPDLSVEEFLEDMLFLGGMRYKEAHSAADKAMAKTGASDFKHKKMSMLSKGMKQKVKIAHAVAHNPVLAIFDEPLNGLDPLSRHNTIELFKELWSSGCTVVVSSHILHEVEAITDSIVLMNKGNLIAQGKIAEIRALIDKYPHSISVSCNDPRKLASWLITREHVKNLEFVHAETILLKARTSNPADCYREIMKFVVESGIEINSMYADDSDLESVFEYLMEH